MTTKTRTEELSKLAEETRLFLEDNITALCAELHEYQIDFDDTKTVLMNKLIKSYEEVGFPSPQMMAINVIKNAAVAHLFHVNKTCFKQNHDRQ